MPTPLLNWLLRSSDQSDGGGGGGDEGPRRVTTCSFCNKNIKTVVGAVVALGTFAGDPLSSCLQWIVGYFNEKYLGPWRQAAVCSP